MRILKINSIDGYKVSCLFGSGETRIIDFEKFFRTRENFSSEHPAYTLLQDETGFRAMEISGGNIIWQNEGTFTIDFRGNPIFHPYEIDPMVLFEFSELDPLYQIRVGMMVKIARREAGLTQAELAERSGTDEYYISRLENNKSDIELLTLKKIIEAGLNRKLKIQIS